MLIELTDFPEQVGLDRSAFQGYRDMFDADIDAIAEAVREERENVPVDPGNPAPTGRVSAVFDGVLYGPLALPAEACVWPPDPRTWRPTCG